jgi:transcriptional regulator with XRE-family HTH domain
MQIGTKIRRLRTQHGLTQQELADRTDLSKGYISQLESEMTSPSIATLVDLLDSLGTNLKDFFNKDDDERLVFSKEDVIDKVDETLGYTISWVVPNAQKNVMEPILLTLEAGGRSESDEPHSGEEFGYVLSGSIVLHVGNRQQKVAKGDSFYFKTTMTHYIENRGKRPAKVLWVSSPPMF